MDPMSKIIVGGLLLWAACHVAGAAYAEAYRAYRGR